MHLCVWMSLSVWTPFSEPSPNCTFWNCIHCWDQSCSLFLFSKYQNEKDYIRKEVDLVDLASKIRVQALRIYFCTALYIPVYFFFSRGLCIFFSKDEYLLRTSQSTCSHITASFSCQMGLKMFKHAIQYLCCTVILGKDGCNEVQPFVFCMVLLPLYLQSNLSNTTYSTLSSGVLSTIF